MLAKVTNKHLELVSQILIEDIVVFIYSLYHPTNQPIKKVANTHVIYIVFVNLALVCDIMWLLIVQC